MIVTTTWKVILWALGIGVFVAGWWTAVTW